MNAGYILGLLEALVRLDTELRDATPRLIAESSFKDQVVILRSFFGSGSIQWMDEQRLWRLIVEDSKGLANLRDFLSKQSPVTRRRELQALLKALGDRLRVSARARLSKLDKEAIFRRYLDGEETGSLAKEFGVGRQIIYNVVSYVARKRGRSPPRRLTSEDRKEIRQLYRDGYSTKFIAERFARTSKTILEVLSRGGVDVQRGYGARRRKAS